MNYIVKLGGVFLSLECELSINKLKNGKGFDMESVVYDTMVINLVEL